MDRQIRWKRLSPHWRSRCRHRSYTKIDDHTIRWPAEGWRVASQRRRRLFRGRQKPNLNPVGTDAMAKRSKVVLSTTGNDQPKLVYRGMRTNRPAPLLIMGKVRIPRSDFETQSSVLAICQGNIRRRIDLRNPPMSRALFALPPESACPPCPAPEPECRCRWPRTASARTACRSHARSPHRLGLPPCRLLKATSRPASVRCHGFVRTLTRCSNDCQYCTSINPPRDRPHKSALRILLELLQHRGASRSKHWNPLYAAASTVY